MFLALIFLVAIGGWIALEVLVERTSIRLWAGGALLGIVVCIAWFSSALLNGFEIILETNNTVKNLTNGLVTITKNEFDSEQLHQNLRSLNQEIIPSYEEYRSARRAVERFLAIYEIEFDPEFPINASEIQAGVDVD